MSNNTALETLGCPNNNLASLDVTGLYSLEYLDCSHNKMTDAGKVTGTAGTMLPVIDTDTTIDRYPVPARIAFVFSPQKNFISTFIPIYDYVREQFADVDENEWYGFNAQGVIARAFEYGLMQGYDDGTFNPTGSINIAQAITIAARVHNIYSEGDGEFVQGEPWYQVYVDYCMANDIIFAGDFDDYNRLATRAEMAYVFSRSLPLAEFAEQNTVNSLPDVDGATPFADAVELLYKAGVVTGDAGTYAFRPFDNVSRAEAAAIITRVVLPYTRTSGRTY